MKVQHVAPKTTPAEKRWETALCPAGDTRQPYHRFLSHRCVGCDATVSILEGRPPRLVLA